MTSREKPRYPHSVNLFEFCKEALNIKHNFEVKVIDQHVGALLGYNPADCSHWKRGKKNLNSVNTVNAIAKHLEMCPSTVTDIMTGRMNVEESVEEYRGYGTLRQGSPRISELSDHEQLRRDDAVGLAQTLLQRADVRTAPVLLPEIAAVVADKVRVVETEDDLGHEIVNVSTDNQGVIWIRYRAGEMKPHLRFLLAKALGRALLAPNAPVNDPMINLHMTVFAGALLIPGNLLQQVTLQMSYCSDLIEDLARYFWLGRTVVNQRLQDFILHGN